MHIKPWLTRMAGVVLILSGVAAVAGEPLKVGYLPVTGHAKFFVAKEQGFFAQEGLDVELIEFINSADGLNAVVAGKLDIGAFGTTAPLAHIAKGADLKIIGGIMGGDASIVTTPETAAKTHTIADLKGKKIVTVRMATGDAVLRGALKEAGLNWKTDVQIFELKNPPAVLEAIKSDQVDAGVLWGRHDLRAEEQGLKIVFHSTDLQPGHPCCRLVIAASRVQDPATWEKFLRAILRAEKFTAENHQATIDAIAKYVKLDRALLERAYYQPYPDQSSDPNLKGVRQFWQVMQSSEFIPAQNRDIAANVNAGIYKKVLDQLVRENPQDPFWRKLQAGFQQKDAL